jgi:hypothetical protein
MFAERMDFMNSNDDILKIFREIARENRKIRLLNVYKGVPISYAARIISIGSASVTVQTEKHQVVSMYREKETYVQNVRFPRLLRASVVLVEPNKLEAMLSNFQYTDEDIGERTHVRLQPGGAIESLLMAEGEKIALQGQLADISYDGVAVIIDMRNLPLKACQVGDPVRVQMKLPVPTEFSTPETILTSAESFDEIAEEVEKTQPFQLKGMIANVKTDLPGNQCRIGIHLYADDPARDVIAEFIALRRAELLREMQAIYELLALETSSEQTRPAV